MSIFQKSVISKYLQNEFVMLVDRNIKFNNESFATEKNLLNRLNSNFAIDKLKEFYLYDFKTFLAELKKKKVELTLHQLDEWEPYFNEHKTLKEQIDKTDREIDLMVYKLYNLTYEEVEIVDPQIGNIISKTDYDKFQIK